MSHYTGHTPPDPRSGIHLDEPDPELEAMLAEDAILRQMRDLQGVLDGIQTRRLQEALDSQVTLPLYPGEYSARLDDDNYDRRYFDATVHEEDRGRTLTLTRWVAEDDTWIVFHYELVAVGAKP